MSIGSKETRIHGFTVTPTAVFSILARPATPQKAGALQHIWVVLASGKMLRLVLPLRVGVLGSYPY